MKTNRSPIYQCPGADAVIIAYTAVSSERSIADEKKKKLGIKREIGCEEHRLWGRFGAHWMKSGMRVLNGLQEKPTHLSLTKP